MLARLHRTFYVEVALLCCMGVTLLIPPRATSVTVWSDISVLSFLRAFIWLTGLSILPGLYILRLTGISESLPRTGRMAIAVNLSLAIVGLATLILYYAQIEVLQLSWVFLGLLSIACFIDWYRSRGKVSSGTVALNKWHLLLIAGILLVVSMSFLVQFNKQYLIGGDNWVSLKPAVDVISHRSVYESFEKAQYPVMFGFVLAGLTACSGFPVVNVYVLLFPLAALNILCFFALAKVVFNMTDKISAMASVIYGIGGGLGWLIQVLVYNGAKDFWTLSLVSQDMYFSIFFWSSIQFSYKSLAITLIFASIITFRISTKIENRKARIASTAVSSLLILFAFLIHMLDTMVLAPVILAMSYAFQKGRSRYLLLGSFLAITGLIAFGIDFLMYGFYSSLTIAKLQLFLLTIDMTKISIYFAIAIGAAVLLILIRHLINQQDRDFFSRRYPPVAKLFIVLSLLGIYLSGLGIWWPVSVSDLTIGFPWYRYVTRYGFVGGLALIGLLAFSWREKWFSIAAFWSIVSIAIGSLWWGERTNNYLFPMLAILASIAIFWIWNKAKDVTLHIPLGMHRTAPKNLRLKPFATALIIFLLVLSSTSVIYGASYYAFVERPTDNDSVRVFSWIYQNTPQNSTILVPKVYTISKGIYTIGDREIFESTKLPMAIDDLSFMNLTETFYENNIGYAVTTDLATEQNTLLKYILSYSRLAYQSGDIRVFQLPQLKPPSAEYTVLVVDREPLGLQNANDTFGWFDDNFAANWTYQNVNARTNGEILTYSWQFNADNTSEPTMKRNIPPIDTNNCPYLIAKYRNTPNTTPTAENNINQIVSLYNQTGSPQGFVKNIYLPIARTSSFNLVSYKLPPDQNITSISIWMRNTKNLTGTIEMQMDYLGFASNDSVVAPENLINFLEMALPSLWPEKYSIVSDFGETGNASTVISTYDNSIPDYIRNAATANTFVLLNTSATSPSWGTEWKEIKNGIFSGYFENKKVIIIGVNSNQENITGLAQDVYEEILRR